MAKFFLGTAWLPFLSIAVLTSPAIAAEAAGENGSPVPWAFATASLILTGVVWIRSRRAGALAAVERAALRDELARLGRLQFVSPVSYVFWPAAADAETLAPNFTALMGESVTGFEQLSQVFSAAEFADIETAAEDLRQDGRPFQLVLSSAKGRIFKAAGRVVTDTDGGALGQVLWIEDITGVRREAAEQAAAAEADGRRDVEALIDTLGFPVWRRGRDLSLKWANRTYADIVKSDPADAEGDDDVELGDSPFSIPQAELAATAKATGKAQRDRRYVVVNGERRAFEIVEAPIGDDEVAGFALDVTELDEVKSELQRHIESHAETLDTLKTAVAIFSLDKHLRFFNSAYAQFWQLDETWLASEPHHSEVLEAMRESRRLPEQADFPAWKKSRLNLYTEVIEPLEEVWHLPDGSTLRVVVQPHPFGGLLVFYEDVTDWLVLERSLNTLLAVQSATLANLYEAVAVYGSDARLKLYNNAFARVWNLEEEFLEGEPHITEVVDRTRDLFGIVENWPDVRERTISAVTNRNSDSGQSELSGGTIIEYASLPLPDGAMLLTYLDVTDRTRIERALRDRTEALETADRLKSEFIANMSYELRTPLNTIIGFGEILVNEYFGSLNDAQREYGDGILTSSQQLLSLVNNILELASIEAGTVELDLDTFDLHATLVSMLGLAREQALQNEHALKFDCPADIGTVEADERRIKQVLFNLLSNAMKFSSHGEQITLGAARNGSWVSVWVADSGPGIATGEEEKIFETFVVGSEGDRYHGAGLGLSMVRSFIELHGGRVELTSSPGEGTCVTCHIPARAEGVKDSGEEPAETARSA